MVVGLPIQKQVPFFARLIAVVTHVFMNQSS